MVNVYVYLHQAEDNLLVSLYNYFGSAKRRHPHRHFLKSTFLDSGDLET